MILYKTVAKEAEARQEIERSKFIAHIKPVTSKDEADAFIADIKKKYRDATHNVPAMVIGDKMQIQWASDDGEPQGTSGAPMLQFLVNSGVTNVALAVTRYFGGTKLGTGGLVRAYQSSAKLALEVAGIKNVEEKFSIEFLLDYSDYSAVERMAGIAGFEVRNREFTDKAAVTLVGKIEEKDRCISEVRNITKGTAVMLQQSILCE